MDDFKTILKEQYKNLPDELRACVESSAWRDSLKSISFKFNLSEQDSETLSIETTLVLFGLLSYRDFEKSLSEETFSMPKEVIKSVADEVYSAIFKSIQTYLDEVDKKEEESKPVMTNGEVLNKIQVLHDIENPQKVPPAFENLPAGATGGNIIDDKLNRIVKLPREEKYIENGGQKPAGNVQLDPYREPIE